MIIGIDLGTTNSLAAYFTDEGPKLIPNSLGQDLTPSAVYLKDKAEVVTGASAKNHLVTHPKDATSKFKRYMGTNQQTRLGEQNFRPEELSALILKSLKADAEVHLGETVTEAVISVPAYFNDIQRKATIAAAEIAGLKVRRLVNEPTAAALAYGLQDKDGENTFLVVDLGGGTFDVSILEMFSGVMEVRASAGDAFLGGEDFTDRILNHFLDKLKLKAKKVSADDLARLRALADRAKHALTEQSAVEFSYAYKGAEHALSLSRTSFEEMVSDLVARMRIPIQRAISDAGLRADEVDRIVLVGGATRMGIVRTLITRLFKRFPEHDLDPDRVVALGAAVQAGLVARDKALDEMVMTDVCPFTLGYEVSKQLPGHDKWEDGLFSPLIERNTVIPASRTTEGSVLKPGQTEIQLNIFQGEAPYVKDNIQIGSFSIRVPLNRKERESIEVRFTYDNSGVLEVIAKSLTTGNHKKLIIEGNPGALTQAQIEERFKELEKIKIHPREEAANEAILSRLAAVYENSLGEKREYISDLLSQFNTVLSSYDKRAIDEFRDHLAAQLESLEDSDVFS
ncbi:Hsp70 family protein [Coralliovum pocilloporae]|uniref:Hsp70 family protein n=1 Tax=Coralliovum pocilloporae TaxID=3066369 RepID=UPI0033071FB9